MDSNEQFAELAVKLGYVYAHPDTRALVLDRYAKAGIEVRADRMMERGVILACIPPDAPVFDYIPFKLVLKETT